jgi:hypothetical protein
MVARRVVESSAASVSLRGSKTPTTTQALRCFSGLPLFMLNSTYPSSGNPRVSSKTPIITAVFHQSQKMIFQRAVRREFTHSAAGVFTALFAIMMTTQLIRCSTRRHRADVDPGAVVALLGFASLNYLPPLLSLSCLSPFCFLSRSYRDSEMVVWFSAGLSLTAWIRPVLGVRPAAGADHRCAVAASLPLGLVAKRRVPRQVEQP